MHVSKISLVLYGATARGEGYGQWALNASGKYPYGQKRNNSPISLYRFCPGLY